MRLYSFFYFIKHLVNKILLLDFEMLKVKILVMSDFLDANNEELLKDYFSEAELMVDNLESNILAIENDPANHDAIDEIFRAAHTLKGNSATVEFTEISTFAHKMEDLLDEVRSDRVQVTEDVVDTLLNSLDIIKAMLEARQNGSVYAESVEEISNKIKSFIPEKAGKGKNSSPAPKPVSAPVQSVPAASDSASKTVDMSEFELLELKQSCQPGQKLWSISVVFDENNDTVTIIQDENPNIVDYTLIIFGENIIKTIDIQSLMRYNTIRSKTSIKRNYIL